MTHRQRERKRRTNNDKGAQFRFERSQSILGFADDINRHRIRMLAPGITSHAVDDGGNAVRLALGTRKRPEQQGIDRPLGSIERGFAGKPRDVCRPSLSLTTAT